MKDLHYLNIVLDIFRCSVLVLVGADKEAVLKGYPKVFKELESRGDPEKDIDDLKEVLKEDDSCFTATTFSFSQDTVSAVVVIYGEDILDVTDEKLVHEMYHATRRICSSHGVDDEETEAYMLEYLCNQFWCAQDEWKKKVTKKKKKQ